MAKPSSVGLPAYKGERSSPGDSLTLPLRPCEPQRIFLFLGGDSAPEETTTVVPGVHLGSSIPLLQRVGRQPGQNVAVFSGYAGWGPGQLDMEMQQSSWIPGECWPGLLFDTPPSEVWNAALRRLDLSPEMVISGLGASA